MREAARCGLDSAPSDAAGWRRSTLPLVGSLGILQRSDREECRKAARENFTSGAVNIGQDAQLVFRGECSAAGAC